MASFQELFRRDLSQKSKITGIQGQVFTKPKWPAYRRIVNTPDNEKTAAPVNGPNLCYSRWHQIGKISIKVVNFRKTDSPNQKNLC